MDRLVNKQFIVVQVGMFKPALVNEVNNNLNTGSCR